MVMEKNAIPASVEEFEEALNDASRVKELFSEPEGFKQFVKDYAGKMAEQKNHELGRQLAELVDGAVKEIADEQGVAKDVIKSRLPMVDVESASLKGGAASERVATKARREAQALNGEWKNFGEFLGEVAQAGNPTRYNGARLKVLGEGQGDQGGFLVPDQFRADLMAVALEAAVIRPRATVIPMSSLSVRMPTIRDATHATNVYGGVQGYWVPESGSITLSDPTFAQAALTAKKLTGATRVSNELLADSAVGAEALVGRLFPEALAYFEDDAFINGVGGGQPQGILNADAIVSVAKETGQAAATIVYENVVKMYSRLLPSSAMRAVWIAHPDTKPALYTMSLDVGTGGSAVYLPAGGAAAAPFDTLFGRPVIYSEKCQTLGTAGDIYLADLSYYLIGDRQTMEMATDPYSRFLTDETQFRFICRIDGRPWIDTALTPRNGSNTLTPFVNLATRS